MQPVKRWLYIILGLLYAIALGMALGCARYVHHDPMVTETERRTASKTCWQETWQPHGGAWLIGALDSIASEYVQQEQYESCMFRRGFTRSGYTLNP